LQVEERAGILAQRNMTEQAIIVFIPLEAIDTGLSVLRLSYPEQVKKIKASMEQSGQLQPVIIRGYEDHYHMIDGFKRFFAAEQLGWKSLEARVIDVPEATAIALMLRYNKISRGLVDYEEALIAQMLKTRYLMKQQEISALLGYSSTWVCRRLALVEKLDECVKDALRMGQITAGHARGLVKLPRGNQPRLLAIIIAQNLTTGQASILIERYLKSGKKQESDWVLLHPLEAIEMALAGKEIFDNRLTGYGNRLLKAITLLSFHQHVFIGQYTGYHREDLTATETGILEPGVLDILKKAKTIVSIITENMASK
jgi:ParB/RepB/Spo0J family partition protein